ncbi:APH(3') family aminoglycoside O-phosphotransferase [Rhizobium sp. 007]|uniref:APH(3') family aminoglycoside O-phosphotransferase n=1 Tax=Rhizobium sp. 007 TaxID=2785056 RepID=UPI00188EE149|nr:APH(3') family aminoglycoside O-phosphotransferase [Rhizobium sp. 007]QPB21954.1 aminoglycoside 3'-phosphotransferase [Rhizobium sp. 007]
MENTALPPSLRALLSRHEWKQDDLGCSSADVFRLAEGGRTRFFLKGEIAGPFAELPLEAERLLWLAEQGLQCPSVVALESHEGRNWLLLSALAGSDLASCKLTTDRQRIEILAAALRRLHELDPETCPFDHRLTARLRLAKARMEAGAVDESDFDEERQNATAASLFAYLEANQPDVTDPVVAHGDACLPNFMTHEGQFSGYVDCGRLGVADRYQDIALALRSIRYNVGEAWVRHFLDCYGLSGINDGKVAYYMVLDEFF